MAVMRLMMKKALMMLNVCDYACDGDDNDAYYDDVLGFTLRTTSIGEVYCIGVCLSGLTRLTYCSTSAKVLYFFNFTTT